MSRWDNSINIGYRIGYLNDQWINKVGTVNDQWISNVNAINDQWISNVGAINDRWFNRGNDYIVNSFTYNE